MPHPRLPLRALESTGFNCVARDLHVIGRRISDDSEKSTAASIARQRRAISQTMTSTATPPNAATMRKNKLLKWKCCRHLARIKCRPVAMTNIRRPWKDSQWWLAPAIGVSMVVVPITGKTLRMHTSSASRLDKRIMGGPKAAAQAGQCQEQL